MTFPKDHLETLWCPWRVEYFEQEKNPAFLEEAARATDDAAHLVLTRRKNAFLLMNRYPYSVGHLLAVPYRKVGDPAALGENEVLDLWNLALRGQKLLREVTRAEGFNIGLNLGECAGAGVPDHLHLHIVPALERRHQFHADPRRTPPAGGSFAGSLRKAADSAGTARYE